VRVWRCEAKPFGTVWEPGDYLVDWGPVKVKRYHFIYRITLLEPDVSLGGRSNCAYGHVPVVTNSGVTLRLTTANGLLKLLAGDMDQWVAYVSDWWNQCYADNPRYTESHLQRIGAGEVVVFVPLRLRLLLGDSPDLHYESTATPAQYEAPRTATEPSHALRDVSFISQYQGLCTSLCDCGAASAAMVLQSYGKRPAGLSDSAWVDMVRQWSGHSYPTEEDCKRAVASHEANLGFKDVQRAVERAQLRCEVIPSSLSPAEALHKVRRAVEAGRVAILLVHGESLGRGSNYGNHWIVVHGYSGDGRGGWVYNVKDPDYPRNGPPPVADGCPRPPWVCGGEREWAESLLMKACRDAGDANGYGFLVGA